MSATRLAYVADLHFGADDLVVAGALAGALRADEPDLLLVGGDLTQRARPSQYADARAWLSSIGVPHLATPGNHDIPLYDVLRRIRDPFGRYRAAVAPHLEGTWRGPETLVAAICTASPRRRVEGRVEPAQVARLAAVLAEPAPPHAAILLTHHPLVVPPGQRARSFEGGAGLLTTATAGGVDLLLSGHRHLPHEGPWLHRTASGRRVVALWAATACSHRRRGEHNGYALIDAAADRLEITTCRWDGKRFVREPVSTWSRAADGWAFAATA